MALADSYASDVFEAGWGRTASTVAPRAAAGPAIGLPCEVFRDRIGGRFRCGGAAPRDLRVFGDFIFTVVLCLEAEKCLQKLEF